MPEPSDPPPPTTGPEESPETNIRRRHNITRPPLPILAILVAMAGIEGGLLVFGGYRGGAFALFAFDPQLMEAARPIYTGHGIVMFLSHAFVHIGPVHMLGNLLVIYLLWYLMPWMYTSDFIVVFFGGAVSGALIFVWFGPVGTTMTGASGSAAALAAVWGLYEMFLIHRGYVLSLRPKRTAVIVGLVTLGVLLSLDQRLGTAWQAHLGGALAGICFGIGLIVRAVIEKRIGPTDPREQPPRD